MLFWAFGCKEVFFPEDALRSGAALFAITMGKDRDNGEVQQMESDSMAAVFQ
ncbi:MAG: hypothetical protein WBI82_07220 [Sphaerochaeta sp.]